MVWFRTVWRSAGREIHDFPTKANSRHLRQTHNALVHLLGSEKLKGSAHIGANHSRQGIYSFWIHHFNQFNYAMNILFQKSEWGQLPWICPGINDSWLKTKNSGAEVGNDYYWSSQKYYYYRRPIGDPSETYWRLTCLIEDWHASSETNMPHPRPIGDQHVSSETLGHPWVSNPACWSLMRHVGLQLVSDETCWSLMGLRWGMLASRWGISGMSISDGSPIIIIFSWTRLVVWESWTCTISIIVQNSGRIRFPGPDQPEKENSTQRHGGVTQFICMNSSIFVI